jgi:hypothetical protein
MFVYHDLNFLLFVDGTEKLYILSRQPIKLFGYASPKIHLLPTNKCF